MNTDNAALKQQLQSLGADESEIESVIDDVNGVIAEHILKEYLGSLDVKSKETMTNLQGPELANYISQHRDTLPPMSEARCAAIATEVWTDYFNFMQQSEEQTP